MKLSNRNSIISHRIIDSFQRIPTILILIININTNGRDPADINRFQSHTVFEGRKEGKKISQDIKVFYLAEID